MAAYSTNNIRNICLLGHGGSGKTSLIEAMLYTSGMIDRLGTPADGNTVSDYDPEEIKRGFSLQASLVPITVGDVKINLLDTPGYLDFVGEVKQAVRVADSALILVDAKAGVETGTELAWDQATQAGIPKAFFINKCDDPDADFDSILHTLKQQFGVSVCPVIVPVTENGKFVGLVNLITQKVATYEKGGIRTDKEIPPIFMETVKKYHNTLLEAIAETSEELMNRYFDGADITAEECEKALHTGLSEGTIAPVFCGSSTQLWGIKLLKEIMVSSFPKPQSIEGSPALFVFKTVADPFVGKMSFFRVMRGTVESGMLLSNQNNGTQEKLSRIYTVCGKKQTEVSSLFCGDLGMTAKLIATNTGDTLSTETMEPYAPIDYPHPFYAMAVTPKTKGDEDKISNGINRLLEEDYTVRFVNDPQTKQLILYGLGDTHLEVLTAKLKNRYGASVVMSPPKIAYREAIKKRIDAEGKHKKQSGGHGQYGHVRIHFAPGAGEDLTFTQSVVGGTVPKNFYPAVEKGLRESMTHGVLAGFPMMNLAADLYDGSYHDVDSSEMAFKIAANLAYKELVRANPIILEPIGELKVYVPAEMVGDIIGDLNKRRGRVLGMEAWHDKKGYQRIEAEVPKAEMGDYTIALRALSQGKGTFTFYDLRYEETPSVIAQKIIAENKQQDH